jgi:NADH dehydrogenase FAD-containing subunit
VDRRYHQPCVLQQQRIHAHPARQSCTNLYLEADDNVFVVGDNANTPYSGMAQTAMHDGAYVHKPITVIPVGERRATVTWGRVTLSGIIGWVLRELADLVAITDYEPWWKAGRQWLVGLEEEEPCRICQQAMHQNIRQIA